MRDLGLLSVSLFIWGLGEGIFLIFQPIYLEQFGAPPSLIGLALGFYGFGQIITHVPAGYLSDRFGPKPLMLAAWLLGTFSAWTMALAAGLPGFILGMLIYGSTLFVLSPLNSYVTAARGNLGVGRAITLTSAAFNLGGVLGPTIGGFIGDLAGLKTSYLVAAILFVFSTLAVLFITPRSVEPDASEGSQTPLRTNRIYIIFLGVVFVAMFATLLPQPLAPNYLQNQQNLSLQQIGWLYSIFGIGMVILNIVIGHIPVRRGVVVCQVSVGLFAGILWRASGLGWYALGYFLLGGYRVLHSLVVARTRPLVGAAQVGLAYAWTETVTSLTIILAPVLAGFLYENNPASIFPIAILLIMVSLGVDTIFNRKYPAAVKVDTPSLEIGRD